MEPHVEQARPAGVETRLSPIIRTPEEMAAAGAPFIDMALEARVLFDRNGFLTGFVERLERVLAKRGAR